MSCNYIFPFFSNDFQTNLIDADAPDLILDSIADTVLGSLMAEATTEGLDVLSYGESSGSFDVVEDSARCRPRSAG